MRVAPVAVAVAVRCFCDIITGAVDEQDVLRA